MPPKSKFSKEQIIEAAFRIAKTEGIGSITIRKVAEQLGSSIAPIYVNFEDVDELKQAVSKEIYMLSNAMIAAQNTGDTFLDVGVASMKFAQEYPIIFGELMLNSSAEREQYHKEMDQVIIQEMKKDSELQEFSEEQLHNLLVKLRIFQVGLSVMATNQSFSLEFTEEKIVEILQSTCSDFINGMKKKNR